VYQKAVNLFESQMGPRLPLDQIIQIVKATNLNDAETQRKMQEAKAKMK